MTVPYDRMRKEKSVGVALPLTYTTLAKHHGSYGVRLDFQMYSKVFVFLTFCRPTNGQEISSSMFALTRLTRLYFLHLQSMDPV